MTTLGDKDSDHKLGAHGQRVNAVAPSLSGTGKAPPSRAPECQAPGEEMHG